MDNCIRILVCGAYQRSGQTSVIRCFIDDYPVKTTISERFQYAKYQQTKSSILLTDTKNRIYCNKLEFDGCIITFDLSNEESLRNIQFLYYDWIQHNPIPRPIILVGCKSDLLNEDEVDLWPSINITEYPLSYLKFVLSELLLPTVLIGLIMEYLRFNPMMVNRYFIKRQAALWKISYFETSAKHNMGVAQAFQEIESSIIKQRRK
jgi:hypothetical protein